MNKVDFLIIGGSAAGTTAAEGFRSLKSGDSIAIVSDANYEEYSRILLSNYIRREVTREKLFLKHPGWYLEKNIELIKNTKAVSLDPVGHSVTLNNDESYQYGKLLIATGGSVIKLKVAGGDLGNVFYLRTLDDADAIVKAVGSCKQAVIVGGGFIGLDFATILRANNVSDITILVLEPYFWQGKLDEASSRVLCRVLEKNGIKIVTNEEVLKMTPKSATGVVDSVITKSGKTYECDLVGIGIGIESDFDWLARAGVKTNRGILTNEYLETNVPDVYAGGDCAEFWDVIFKRQHIMGNWANATSQGLAVGKTIAGVRTVFETASSCRAYFCGRPLVDTSQSAGTGRPPRVEAGGHCSVVGGTDEGLSDQIIVRGSVENNKMSRIFIKTIDGVMRIVGATVINNPAEVGPLTMAVKEKIDISVHKDRLGDASFDLKELVY